MHNRGMINALYIEKSGDLARGSAGEQIEINGEYFNYMIAVLKGLSDVVARDIARTFKSSRRARVKPKARIVYPSVHARKPSPPA